MTDLLQENVTVKGPKGDTYVFKIPSLHDEFRVSARVKNIRKQIDPDWDGVEQGMDWFSVMGMQAAATFEVLLVKSSATWPYTASKSGEPIVDSSKFPITMVDEVRAVYSEYMGEVRRFRDGGAADDNADGKEAVAGERDIQEAPLPR